MSVAIQLIRGKPVCRTTDARRGIGDCLVLSVVLCSARADAESIREVLPALASGGLIPRMLVGIDEDESLLSEILAETRAPTVFVVCASSALGAVRQRALVEAFARGRGAQHRLIVVELDARHPHALVTPIRRATDSIRRRLAPPPVGEAKAQRRLFRDEVGPIPAFIRLPQAAQRRPTARVLSELGGSSMAEAPPVPVRVDASAPTPRDGQPAVAIEPAANTPPRERTGERGAEDHVSAPRWSVAVALIGFLSSAFLFASVA